MNSRTRNVMLTAVGLVSLAAYIVACRASFSPDGKKVMFPYVHSAESQTGIALHDLEKGTTRSLFVLSSVEGDNPRVLTARWSADGKHGIILWPEKDKDDSLTVLALPLEPGGASKLFRLPQQKDPVSSCVLPPPCIGHHLFVGGEAVKRLDLETGEIRVSQLVTEHGITGEGVHLTQRESTVFYIAQRKDENENATFEVGTVDRDSLELQRRFTFSEEDAGTPNVFLAVSPDASRMALATEEDDRRSIVIFQAGRIQERIGLQAGRSKMEVGNVLWSPDSKRLFAAAAWREGENRVRKLGILEVPLGEGEARELPLIDSKSGQQNAGGGLSNDVDAVLLLFQLALSPDGGTLAASTGYLDVPEEDRALFLVDLKSPERAVKKVPLPTPPPSGATAPGK